MDYLFLCQIGAHTVFAREEKCLYFRYVKVGTTHTTGLILHNRKIIPADVELILQANSLVPETVKPDVFTVAPKKDRVPAMAHKRFTVSFKPSSKEVIFSHWMKNIEIRIENKLGSKFKN